MKGFRSARSALALSATVLSATLLAAACGPIDEPGFASDVERELERGRAHATRLVAETRHDATREAAILAGYLERHRLGLGSPFRLIENLLVDPRLPTAERERLAWALLARTLDGDGHRLDPRAQTPGGDLVAAMRHIELVEGAVRGSATPDGGVLAVRLAYATAAAEGGIDARQSRYAARSAALVRDRMVARQDARRLLRAAGETTDPLALVTIWRVERRFEVERPSMPALSRDVEREAIELAPRLVDAIRRIGDRPRGGPLIPAPESHQRPLLSPAAAAALALEAAVYDSPPQTPVAVAVDTYRRAAAPATPAAVEQARNRFFESARNEERLAAEHALLYHAGGADPGARLAVLSAAVGLRAYAQERPWFPGFEGPSGRELEDRFGLAGVHFPSSMPAHWRPYYRRMLHTALSDLQRVLPSLDVRGLRIRFEPRSQSPGTLAVHDPRSRTIFIPAATGAGTLAHEIAHDLDWQTALRRYNVRGDYATDRAMRLADDRLARVLRGLTAAAFVPTDGPEHLQTHASRPAEIFARSVDWFVAVALAREGRLNGYLSSVQDDVLTGYGTVTPPDVSGAAGQALITLLDEVAPVYPETRRWFLDSYGRVRAPTTFDLARRILEAPLDEPDGAGLARLATTMAVLDQLEAVRDDVLRDVDAACQTVGYDDRLGGARRDLVGRVTQARARGMALDRVGALVGPEGRRWMEARIDGRDRNTDLDPVVIEALEPLAHRVRAIAGTRVEASGLMPEARPADCARLPFLRH